MVVRNRLIPESVSLRIDFSINLISRTRIWYQTKLLIFLYLYWRWIYPNNCPIVRRIIPKCFCCFKHDISIVTHIISVFTCSRLHKIYSLCLDKVVNVKEMLIVLSILFSKNWRKKTKMAPNLKYKKTQRTSTG